MSTKALTKCASIQLNRAKLPNSVKNFLGVVGFGV